MCTYYVGRHLRNAAKIVCKLKGRGATSGPVLGGGSNKDHETNMRIIVDVLDITTQPAQSFQSHKLVKPLTKEKVDGDQTFTLNVGCFFMLRDPFFVTLGDPKLGFPPCSEPQGMPPTARLAVSS